MKLQFLPGPIKGFLEIVYNDQTIGEAEVSADGKIAQIYSGMESVCNAEYKLSEVQQLVADLPSIRLHVLTLGYTIEEEAPIDSFSSTQLIQEYKRWWSAIYD